MSARSASTLGGSSTKKSFVKGNKVKLYQHKEKRWVKDKNEILQLEEQCAGTINTSTIKRFLDLPISKRSFLGLQKAGYTDLTEIQRESIPLALKGLDILGAAKTGSGKTLAFLIPVLEKLYRNQWTHLDGLGALIITPVRELAYQIFEVLKKIGRSHEFSAGLIIGGKDLKFEKTRLKSCNIIIGTPGRLLQHMDENPLLDCSNLQILVLDEADRILDMGFSTTMNAIVENLPTERQTLLFSATQTRSVKDLARLSLKDPVYVSVHEHAQHSTPNALQQSYIVCELHEKMDMLWSFIKHHLKQKILVFMTSCKQVKYTYEALCRLRPGMSVMALYGSLHQLRRMAIYDDFCNKTSVVLIATDIAARGLDFPSVNWVLQLDCPDDVNTYIHRAGRTARYEADGESLLVLLPSEEGMIAHLQQKKIPIKKIRVNPSKQHSIQRKLEAALARDVKLKETAQRAFVSYIKSVFLMKDKKVFDVNKLDTTAYANSLGLAVPPRIRFLQRHQKKVEQNNEIKKISETSAGNIAEQNRLANESNSKSDSGSESSHEEPPINQTLALSFGHQDDSESDDDLFTVKRRVLPSDAATSVDSDDDVKNFEKKSLKAITKAALAKKILKKNIKANNKIIFDDDGKIMEDIPKRQLSEISKDADNDGGLNIEKAQMIMKEEDKIDKQLYRQRIKALHKEKRLKEKERRNRHRSQKIKEGKEEDEASSSDEALDVDLDFLPDPDEVYGNQNADATKELMESPGSDDASESLSSDSEERESTIDETESESDSGESSTNDHHLRNNKRKEGLPETVRTKKRLRKDLTPLDTGLSIVDDEELALHLLSKS